MENLNKYTKAFGDNRFVGAFYDPATGRGGVIADGNSAELMQMVSTLLTEIPQDAADMAVRIYQRGRALETT